MANAGTSPDAYWNALLPQPLIPEASEDPFAAWTTGGGQMAEARTEEVAFPVDSYDIDSSSSSATSSDDGLETMDAPDLSQMGEAEATETRFY